MNAKLSAIALVVSLVASVALQCTRSVKAAPVQGGSVRIVGPRGESTPVVNENNQLQMRVEGAESVSRWTTDNPEVATVGTTGLLSGRQYGFATITAETPAGRAQVIVVVVRKTPRRASRAQGDTKTDTGGNVYLSSPLQHVIYRAGASGSGVFAGGVGQADYRDGAGTQARFNVPTGLGVDQSARGGVYVADTENHCVRRIRPNGTVEVVAGLPEHAGTMTADATPMAQAVLSGPRGVVVAGGNLMVADTENHCVWYMDLERQEVRIVAGEPGTSGLANGRGRAARFNRPSGLAISTDGRLVAIADTGNNVVRLIAIGQENGTPTYDVTTLGQASSRRGAEVAKAWGEDRGEDALAFDQPESVSIDDVGNVYVIDATSAVVVTRREEALERVDLAEFGTLGDPASVTLSGTQAFVLDATATTDEAVNVVEVGAPAITSVTPAVTALRGGEEIVVHGKNFAPESVVTVGGAAVTEFEVESATRIRLVAPAQRAPGQRTVTVATRGGLGQAALEVRARAFNRLNAGRITTIAGGVPYLGDGGAAALANLGGPLAVAVDGSGNLYVADRYNNRVRRVDSSGRITSVAGTGDTGYNGDGRPATSAWLNDLQGVAVDGAGNLYIADSNNHRVRRVDASGQITTVAGTGVAGYNGDDRSASSAQLRFPVGIELDASGNLYIADTYNYRIRRVDTSGQITTVAGSGLLGYNGDDRPASSARLNTPTGVEVDGSGNLYIADYLNNRIRRVDASGQITTVAGTGAPGYDGDDKPATSARLNNPAGVAIDASGNLYIADYLNSRIRRVDASGQITTVAGDGLAGYNGDDRPASSARLNVPTGVEVDGSGNLYIADQLNHRIRRVDASGRITTVAGTGVFNYDGDDKPATSARLGAPFGVDVDGSGNLYIADFLNHRIRRVDASGRITTVAGTGAPGYDGDDKPATSASLNSPSHVVVDASGNLYIADSYNHRVRRVDATGRITTVAGTGEAGYNGDDKPATSATLNFPYGIAVDGSGNLYIADSENNRIRKVNAAGRITTVAGTGAAGYNGDGVPATNARLNFPGRVALDSSGGLYIADTYNSRVRRVDATGRITTVAGTGVPGYDGDDKPAIEAKIVGPYGIEVDGAGNLYIADFFDHRIRRVNASGRIATVAGTGEPGYDGDNKPARSALLTNPAGVAVDASGNLYIADTYNYAIRAIKKRR